MNYRSKHLPIYTFLIGILILSLSFNYYFYQKITELNQYISYTNYWVTPKEFQDFKQEIKRLESFKP